MPLLGKEGKAVKYGKDQIVELLDQVSSERAFKCIYWFIKGVLNAQQG